MLTVDEAKKIGFSTCIDVLGYEFCKLHCDNSVKAFSVENMVLNCFVGVNDTPMIEDDFKLTSCKKWPYAARCEVSLTDGTVEITENRKPDKTK